MSRAIFRNVKIAGNNITTSDTVYGIEEAYYIEALYYSALLYEEDISSPREEGFNQIEWVKWESEGY